MLKYLLQKQGLYWHVRNCMGILSLWLNKIGVLPSSIHVSTIVKLHHWGFSEEIWEKARWEPYKDAAYCFVQILEAAFHKQPGSVLHTHTHIYIYIYMHIYIIE